MTVCHKCKNIKGVIFCTVDSQGRHQSINGLPSQVKKFELPMGGTSYCFTWHHQGITHREDGPAKIGINGKAAFFHFYKNGVMHREDGPAAVNDGLDDDWWMQGKVETRMLVDEFNHKPFDVIYNPKVSHAETHHNNQGNYINQIGEWTLIKKMTEDDSQQVWEAFEGEMTICHVRLVKQQ